MRILLIVYDNQSYIPQFPMGIAYLTAVLEKSSEVVIYQQDLNHSPDKDITRLLDEQDFDLVGLSFIGGYYQYHKAVAISQAVRASKKNVFYVLGGHGPSPEPEFFMKKMQADAICIGEGEETILDLVDALKARRSLATVKGIAYRDASGNTVVNERRAPIADIDHLPFPAYHRFPMEYYRLKTQVHKSKTEFSIAMLSGRGCTFRCNFCYRMDTGFRPRSNEAIIEEIRMLQKDYGITYIAFLDELLMSSQSRTESFAEALIKANLNIRWTASGRLNFAKPDLLRLMRKAGCVFLNYGIEALDDAVLRNAHKGLTTGQIVRGVEATLAAGISPGLNIIFGNYGDNWETLRSGVDFILKYDDFAQLRTIRPVTPYPGCELYYDAIKSGKLKDCEDFYENKHTNSDLLSVNFTELSDDEFYKALFWANETLLSHYHGHLNATTHALLEDLYIKKNAAFRGFRQ